MRISWGVEDGYVGKSRPQSTELSIYDFEEDMTDEDIIHAIYDAVQDDFNQKISYFVENIDEVVATVKQQLKERGE